jgi:hypothetical protein
VEKGEATNGAAWTPTIRFSLRLELVMSSSSLLTSSNLYLAPSSSLHAAHSLLLALTSILKLLSIFLILESFDSTSLILFDLSDPDLLIIEGARN